MPAAAYAFQSAVPVNMYIAPLAVPAVVEAQVRFDERSVPVDIRETPIGPRFGFMAWRDETGRPHTTSMADYNRRYWAQMDGINLGPDERPKRFIVIDRFIAGDDDTRDWAEGLANLARAGANALALAPSSDLRELLLKAGLHRTAWSVHAPPGYALGLTPYVNDATLPLWAQKLAAQFYKAGYSPQDIAAYNLSDEPGWYYPAATRLVAANPTVLSAFREYFKAQGLSPADVGASAWDQVMPLGQSVLAAPATRSRLDLRRRFYWTMRFFPWYSAEHYARATRALEAAFYSNLPVFTNWNNFMSRFYGPGPMGHNQDPNSPDVSNGGQDWLEFGRLRGGTRLWTEDWFRDFQAYQWSFYAARMRSASRKAGIGFGGYVIGRETGDKKGGLLQKVLSIIGGGGKAVCFYVFGPEYVYWGNSYSEHPQVLRDIAQANRIIAAAEDLLWPGRPPRSQVAILAPRSAEVWDVLDIPRAARNNGIIYDGTNRNLNAHTVDYMAEGFDQYLALQHANIPADFVDEDDLTPGGLRAFRVLYITEPDIPVEGQHGISQWVRQGGTVVMVNGAGAKDRYDERSSELEALAGVQTQPRPRLLVLSLALLRPAGRIRVPGGDEITAFGTRSTIAAAGANVAARFEDGTPAVTERDVQKGHVVYFNWFPGLSYVYSKSGFPGGFPAAVRRQITEPIALAKVKTPSNVNMPMVEAPVLLSDKGAAVVLLNWRDQPIQRLTVSLHVPFVAREVRSVTRGPIMFQHNGSVITCTLPLDAADVLTIRPAALHSDGITAGPEHTL
ncbi:MAG: beta-galactosidase trimerization domain-containing protein [Candidatus Binataceae bacterium]